MTGIFLRLLSVALLTAMSSVVHHLAQTLPVGQIMVWRSFVAALVIFIFAGLRAPLSNLLPNSLRAHAIRGGLGGAAHLYSVEAVKRSKVSTLAPFDYIGLVFALGIDVMIFKAIPSGMALIGMVLSAGLSVLAT